MADFSLTATAALGGFDETIGTVRLREVTGLAIVSIAANARGTAALTERLGPLPAPGTSSQPNGRRLVSVGLDQWFAIWDHPGGRPDAALAEIVGDAAALTDQSDAWVIIEVSGPGLGAAMERLSPVDLSDPGLGAGLGAGGGFGPGRVARTSLEHMGAIVLRPGVDPTLWVMTGRSSAQSMRHALEVSARNTA